MNEYKVSFGNQNSLYIVTPKGYKKALQYLHRKLDKRIFPLGGDEAFHREGMKDGEKRIQQLINSLCVH